MGLKLRPLVVLSTPQKYTLTLYDVCYSARHMKSVQILDVKLTKTIVQIRYLNLFALEEIERLVKIFNFLYAHATAVGLAQLFAADNLEQFDQQHAVAHVDKEVDHLHARLQKNYFNYLIFN